MTCYGWKMIVGLYSLMTKVEILGTSCIMCAHALRGYPYSITRVRTRTSNGRRTIVMFCVALPWWLLVLTGVRPKELPEYARPTRKVAQRCANWLVRPYSHVWVVYSVTTLNFHILRVATNVLCSSIMRKYNSYMNIVDNVNFKKNV